MIIKQVCHKIISEKYIIVVNPSKLFFNSPFFKYLITNKIYSKYLITSKIYSKCLITSKIYSNI